MGRRALGAGLSWPLRRGGFVFRQAQAGDDALLRGMLRSAALPGWVDLDYQREPSYFAGSAIDGEGTTVIVVGADGEPVGCFSIGARPAWILGRPRRLGYLGQLRILPRWQGHPRLILRGFSVLREMLAEGRPDLYRDTPFLLTSILTDNARARRLLTSGLKGLPSYLPLRALVTFAAGTHQPWAGLQPRAPYRLAPAGESDLGIISSLLGDYGRRYSLHPCWDPAGLRALASAGWRVADGLILLDGDRPVGCGSLWDQRGVRQWRVRGYAGALALARPLVSGALGLAGFPRLPVPGHALDQAMLSHLALLPGHEPALPLLIGALLRLARERGLGSVAFGLCADHPWHQHLSGLRALRYRSQLYLVHWDEGRAAARALADAPVQVEVACL